jgi:hypothetical protein
VLATPFGDPASQVVVGVSADVDLAGSVEFGIVPFA